MLCVGNGITHQKRKATFYTVTKFSSSFEASLFTNLNYIIRFYLLIVISFWWIPV